jgi:hypothetical protein
MKAPRKLIPVTAQNDDINNAGTRTKFANIFFLLLAIIGVVRSCIHLLSPDGGAGSIAGLDVNIAGGDGIVFAFALWGGAQLLMAVVQIIVYFRYKNLIPLMYVLLIAEIVLRMLAGWLHPLTFSHVPPGAVANYIVLVMAIIMLMLLMIPARRGETQT